MKKKFISLSILISTLLSNSSFAKNIFNIQAFKLNSNIKHSEISYQELRKVKGSVASIIVIIAAIGATATIVKNDKEEGPYNIDCSGSNNCNNSTFK